MQINILIIALTFIWSSFFSSSPNPPETFALTNATVYTITNGIIEDGTVIIRNGKIEAVGKNITVPSDAKVIDCSGKRIYPGFIDSGNGVGLVEVGSLPETMDNDELGNYTPQMQALTAVNPNSVAIPITRLNGITTTLALPTGGTLPGTAALINMHGYTPDQMFAGFKGVVMNFPSSGRRGFFDRRSDEEIKKASDTAFKNLNELWDRAEEFAKLKDATPKESELVYSPEYQALYGIVKKQQTLLIEVNKASDIEKAINWVEKRKYKVVFTGVSEGWRVADKLATSKIPCIVGPILAIPSRESDRYDRAYANAGLLHEAGVQIALRTNDESNSRNLPFHAGYAAAYGLGNKAALEAITIAPATIFGVEDQLGSIEAGKIANLFVVDQDPFETKAQIAALFIHGYQIPLESRHTELYDEFLQRNPGLNK